MSDRGKAWIGTSWKMNKTLPEATEFALSLASVTFDPLVQPFIVPPFTSLREVKRLLEKTPVRVGAQNMHWAESGPWTGEISPAMLTDCGADLVELGHSERRRYFGETDEAIGLKVEAAVRHGLMPLVCIGETADQRDRDEADQVLERQVETALGNLVGSAKTAPVLLAYEPVWAIGEKGQPAPPAYADQRHAHISAVASELTGQKVPCLYGGSVNADNCVDLISRPHVDGLFIGRSAWASDGYINIVGRCARALQSATQGKETA